MKEKIQYELSRIEREYGVRVLFAAEAGARAWGIASVEAGHVVHFIFSAPGKSASRTFNGVIERPVNAKLTLKGVDLQRALSLLLDSSAPLLELLRSPLVYAQDERFAKRFRSLAGRFFDAERSFAYYLRQAERIERECLRDGRPPLAKDLEALRAALSARWIHQKGVPPPVEFARLVDESVQDVLLRLTITEMILSRQQGGEHEAIPRDKTTGEFLRESLLHLKNLASKTCRTEKARSRLMERILPQRGNAPRRAAFQASCNISSA